MAKHAHIQTYIKIIVVVDAILAIMSCLVYVYLYMQ